jgi:hypothetical protein
LFWVITALLVYCIAQRIPTLDLWFNNKVAFNFRYIIGSLWDIEGYPIAYPFWFIRDLMITVVLTPVIYFFIRKAKVYGVLLLGVLWFLNWWFVFAGLSIIAVFFFTAGAWFGSNKRNIIDDMGKVKYLLYALYPVLVMADLLTENHAANPFIHNAGRIAGIVFWVNLAAHLLRTGKVRVSRFLAAASFFVYAIHEPFMLSPIRKITYAILNPQSDLTITALYFFVVLVVVLIALELYYLLKRFMPKFTTIITGGR